MKHNERKDEEQIRLEERRRRAKQTGAVLAENLRLLHKHNHWSQEEIADKTGLSINEVGRLERNETIPGLDVLIALSEGLGLSLPRLLDPALPPTSLIVGELADEEKAIMRDLSELPEEERRYLLGMLRQAIAHFREKENAKKKWRIDLP